MIGTVIVQLLKASDALMELVDADNIFPYVASENTPLPVIVYTIGNVDPDYNKDGWVGDGCEFSIFSISEDYATLQSIVKEVRAALELKRGTYGTIKTWRIELTGHNEGYNIAEEAFLNKLTFSVRIIDY